MIDSFHKIFHIGLNIVRRNQMKLRCLAFCMLMVGVSSLLAEDDGNKFKAKLIGFRETPSILSNGTGTFIASLDRGGTSISYAVFCLKKKKKIKPKQIHTRTIHKHK